MRPIRASTFLFVLLAIALGVGFTMPSFYDWTGADQSRPTPWIWALPLGVGIPILVFSMLLPYLPIQGWEVPKERPQFKIGMLLAVTALIAVLTAIGIRFPAPVASLCFFLAVCFELRIAAGKGRWVPILALHGCITLPFLWLFDVHHLSFMEGLIGCFVLAPGFIASMMLSAAFGLEPHSTWLPLLMSSTLIVVGASIIYYRVKLAIAYISWITIMTLFGSIVLNALMRA